MADRLVAIRMAVWLRTFPAFVLVPVVIVVDVRGVMRERLMGMLDLDGIVCGPERQRRCDIRGCPSGYHEEGRAEPDRCPEPTGGRIGDEPAGMREGELGGEDGGPAVGVGGAAEEESAGCAYC